MSISNELEKLRTNIANAYLKLEEKGATLPTNKNTDNLATTIESVTGGSGVSLATPVVTINSNGLATWRAVENAEFYSLDIDGVMSETTSTSKQLTSGQTLTVRAAVKTYGEYSEAKQFLKLATPILDLNDKTGLATWEAVENADYYELNLNGVISETTETSKQLSEGDKLKLRAISNNSTIYSSEYSSTVHFVTVHALIFESDDNFSLMRTFPAYIGSGGVGSLEYSLDNVTWSNFPKNTTITSTNCKIYLRGNNLIRFNENSTSTTKNKFIFSNNTSEIRAKGNIDYLLDYNTVKNGEVPPREAYTFAYMFHNCTSLAEPPMLSSPVVKSNGYRSMFQGCTSLRKAPKLPAIDISENCYSYMFYGCTSLKFSTSKGGIYQYEYRIPTSGTISTTPSGAKNSMIYNTGGTFMNEPSYNTTYYTNEEPV